MKRRVATLLAAVVVVAGTATSAWAFFTAGTTSGSRGQALAGTLPAGSAPKLALSGRDVALSWTQSALPGENGGYVLERYAASGGGPITPAAPCDGLQQGGTCTENVVPTGRWTYTLSPHYAGWVGSESTPSAVVVIAPAAPGSVTLTNASIDNTNASDLDVDVAVPGTSLATDTVRLTISDGASEVTQNASPAVDGATTVHFNGLDVSSLADGALIFAATAASSYGDESPTTSRSYAKDTVVAITPPTAGEDTTAPVLSAAIVEAQDGTYVVYADATDDQSGVDTASLTANVEAISGGAGGDCGGDCTSVALTYNADGFTVANPDGTTSTYHYRSAELTAQTTPTADATAFAVSGRDLAGNTAATG